MLVIMRIVAVADTHMFERDLGELPDGDVFIHAGDMIRAGTLAEFEHVAAWLRALPYRHKVVIAGNHDWCFVDNAEAARELLGDRITYLQDSGVTIDGVSFWGSPWQPAYNDWAFNLPRGQALAEKWALIPDTTDVLITHGPPHGIGDNTMFANRQGCEELLAAALRVAPALHVFGHIHQDGGVWNRDGVCFANVTTWECERAPTVFDIDPATRRVEPVAVPPPRG
jgi:Icc-related predicted phosphoesterase